MAMGCQQCLPLSVVPLKGKLCQKAHCRNGDVDTFGHRTPAIKQAQIFLRLVSEEESLL
jgi:hypothetical protein